MLPHLRVDPNKACLRTPVVRWGILAFTGAVLAAVALALGTPSQAAAGSHGCPDLSLCLYKTEADWTADHPSATYQGVTRDPQDLGPEAYGSYAVYSALGDVRAILTLLGAQNGQAHGICVSPGEQRVLYPDTVTTIHIDEKSGC
ncbi:hypothetical protein ACFV2N_17295 [Streptomyces sp. NPDC059680]|uniref:hypothetical protein n=1 Tax=Streptomyces sp. NPDC059680 TaxID=3346904 RepID=UPI0036AB169F